MERDTGRYYILSICTKELPADDRNYLKRDTTTSMIHTILRQLSCTSSFVVLNNHRPLLRRKIHECSITTISLGISYKFRSQRVSLLACYVSFQRIVRISLLVVIFILEFVRVLREKYTISMSCKLSRKSCSKYWLNYILRKIG